ncbi:MAG: DUF3299 domain-containing protein [Bacteroidetes bacterium]|nr:MAG: DUF3299 domain-containing protein [Bacteroidota bacterium]
MKRIRTLLLLPVVTLLMASSTPIPFIGWPQLENVEFAEKFVKEVDGYMLFPKFPDALKKLAGKTIMVEGYVVPVDKSGTFIALSANPYAACFFCGKAGPASVMTVKLKTKNPNYKIDDVVRFMGTLRLNDDDIKEFYYVLENAIPMKQ